MFFTRYVDLCNSVGKAPTKVASELGITSGSVNGWKNGAVPRLSALRKIAEYFNVSVEYLTGEEAAVQQKESTNIPTAQNAGADNFIKLYNMLTPDRQALLRERMIDLIKEQVQG